MLTLIKFEKNALHISLKKTIKTLTVPVFAAVLMSCAIVPVSAHLYRGYSTIDNLEAIPEDKYPCAGAGLIPEFHSLRPYQAAPCGDSDKTLYCINNYQLEESISTTWSPACVDNGGSYSCPPDAGDSEIEKIYSIDGEYARFPIMGNTENVKNSQNAR